MERDVVIAGGGIFGITAASARRRCGFAVTVFDPGPLPHPLAESTDISKIVRMDYGPDEVYLALMEEAVEGWRRYNARWPRPLYRNIAKPEGILIGAAGGAGMAATWLLMPHLAHAITRVIEPASSTTKS